MNDISDFQTENGFLTKYKGHDPEVTIPEGEMEYFPERSFVWIALRRIRPMTWNRRTNHVIAFLDQITRDDEKKGTACV